MKQIKTYTSPPEELQEQVVFLTNTGIAIHRYGEIDDGRPYILVSDLKKLLQPRTDSERVEWLECSPRGINIVFKDTGWVAENYGEDMFRETQFDTWRSAVDALMDMEEMA